MNWTIRNARIFSAPSPQLSAPCTLLIRNGRIHSVLPSNDFVPTDDPIIDLAGRALLPGFIDLHVHLGMTHTETDAARYESFAPARVTLLAAARLREALHGGVTTLRDVGSRVGDAIAARDMVASGVIPGPRVFAAGDSLTYTGGHAHHQVDGPWKFRKAIREQIRNGADWIKIGQSDDKAYPGLTERELAAICDETHRLGRRVAVHVDREPGYVMAVRAGVDTVEHGFWPSEDTLQEMLHRGTYWVPTISVNRGMRHREHTPDSYEQVLIEGYQRRRGVPRSAAEKRAADMRAAFEAFPGCFQRGLQLGIRIATGTDAPLAGLRMDAVRNEIIRFVEWGMTPSQALSASTCVAADVLGQSHDFGTIEPGKRADLIAVEGNPLDDITRIDSVCWVMKDGQVFRDDRE